VFRVRVATLNSFTQETLRKILKQELILITIRLNLISLGREGLCYINYCHLLSIAQLALAKLGLFLPLLTSIPGFVPLSLRYKDHQNISSHFSCLLGF
jgi:hypothetical protein